MLPAQYRLKNRKDFNEVFRQGKTFSNEVLIIKYKEKEAGKLKIGFSVGLKVSKKPSKRNKIKRWMREALKPFLKEIKTGYQIIFLINSNFPCKQISYSLIREKIENLLRRSRLIK